MEPKLDEFSNQPGKMRQNADNQGESLQIIRNFDDPFDASPIRTKLTREELLAGHSTPPAQNGQNSTDPRFKSPDEFLLRKAATAQKPLSLPPIIEPKKGHPMQIQQPSGIQPLNNDVPLHFGMPDLLQIRKELDIERAQEKDARKEEQKLNGIHIQAAPFSNLFGTAHIAPASPKKEEVIHDMAPKEQSANEISQWKEYAQQVKMWQSQVMGIVQNLKAELRKQQGTAAEIALLKEQIRIKDEEIQSLQRHGKSKLLGWMKGLGRVGT